jgi:hypothetical protein
MTVDELFDNTVQPAAEEVREEVREEVKAPVRMPEVPSAPHYAEAKFPSYEPEEPEAAAGAGEAASFFFR